MKLHSTTMACHYVPSLCCCNKTPLSLRNFHHEKGDEQSPGFHRIQSWWILVWKLYTLGLPKRVFVLEFHFLFGKIDENEFLSPQFSLRWASQFLEGLRNRPNLKWVFPWSLLPVRFTYKTGYKPCDHVINSSANWFEYSL